MTAACGAAPGFWGRVSAMALSARLTMRQGQSLVLTPQLLQAIKLLQLSSADLAAFVEEELERNPMLERDAEAPGAAAPEQAFDHAADAYNGQGGEAEAGEAEGGEWASEALETSAAAIEGNLGTEISNSFDADRPLTAAEMAPAPSEAHLSADSWSGAGAGSGSGDGEAPNLEAYVAAEISLRDHLAGQLAHVSLSPADALIGQILIDLIDDNGYFSGDLDEIAERLSIAPQRALALLTTIQGFDPPGIGARDLAECLAIQLAERDRLDPAMQAMLAHLPLLARRDFAALRRICGVDEEDMADMVAEIRALDPKPGRAFGGAQVQAVTPDVFVRAAADGSWLIELNSEALPRVLVNQVYAARVSKQAKNDSDRSFVANCLQSANWLTKSLEQRAKTILKVSSEIVRQQDGFFAMGVAHLRPLNLKTIADAIGMHESTVSRVTANKYMMTPRGLFELKYFFTASIAASAGGEGHSAESVRHRIRQMIDAEDPRDVLSDDAIVLRLKDGNIDIARRTVAKYREALRIPSSVERRREKLGLMQRAGKDAAA